MSRALETAKGALQAAPPVYVFGQTLIFGIPLSEFASWLAIVYTVLVILTHVRKQWVPWLVSKPWRRSQWWNG